MAGGTELEWPVVAESSESGERFSSPEHLFEFVPELIGRMKETRSRIWSRLHENVLSAWDKSWSRALSSVCGIVCFSWWFSLACLALSAFTLYSSPSNFFADPVRIAEGAHFFLASGSWYAIEAAGEFAKRPDWPISQALTATYY